jgi:hypothetical protein
MGALCSTPVQYIQRKNIAKKERENNFRNVFVYKLKHYSLFHFLAKFKGKICGREIYYQRLWSGQIFLKSQICKGSVGHMQICREEISGM